MNEKIQSKLDRATRALLGMGKIEHKESKFTVADLKRRFVIRLDRKGQAGIKEV